MTAFRRRAAGIDGNDAGNNAVQGDAGVAPLDRQVKHPQSTVGLVGGVLLTQLVRASMIQVRVRAADRLAEAGEAARRPDG
jgi:hypothetical protein